MLKPGPAGDLPVIASERSTVGKVVAGLPELLKGASALFADLTLLVDEDNRRAAAGILANIDDLTGRLARRGPQIEQLIVNLERTTAQLIRMTARLDEVLARADSLMDSADATLSVARGIMATADDVLETDARAALRCRAASVR